MNEWRDYPGERKFLSHKDGFIIIKQSVEDKTQPLSCEVCNHVFRTRDDAISWQKFGCCNRCELFWAAPRKEEWAKGWRPDPNDVKNAEQQRSPIITLLDIE